MKNIGTSRWAYLALKKLYSIQNKAINIPSFELGCLETRITTFLVEMQNIWQKLVHR